MVLRASPLGAPLRRHPGEIVDQEVGRGAQILGAPLAIAVRAFLGVEIGRRTRAVAGTGAVQVLAPQQELDGVIAGGDIGLDAARLLQLLGEKLLGDLGGVELLAADGERGVGDHVGGVELVLGRLGPVTRGDVIDQPLVERPGIHLAFPIVDDGVAEAVGLGLHVRDARGDPGGARGAEIVLGRLGEESVDRELERLGRVERVGIAGLRDIRVGLQHLLGRGLGQGRGRCKAKTGRQRGDRQGGQWSSKHQHPLVCY